MAGRPRRQAMIAELLKRTRDEFDDQPDATPLDYVELYIASGGTLKRLADEIAQATKPGEDDPQSNTWSMSGEMVRRHLEDACGVDETETRLTRARARSTYGLVDEAIAIAEDTIPEAGFVARDRLRVSTRHWMAERFNPSTFGQSKGVSLNVSIGSLHLDALRSTSHQVTGTLTAIANALPATTSE